MTALGWYFLTFANVIFSFTFLFKRYGKFWLVTIPAIFMFSFVVFNVLGANYIISEYNIANIKYIVALNMAVIIHTVMFTIVDSIFKFNFRQELNSFIKEPISDFGYQPEFKITFSIIVIIIFGITILYLNKLKSIPIIELINHPSARLILAKSRELATTTFEGKYHKIDIWEGSGNFYSHAFYIKGYVCRVQLMANASIPTFAELKMYLYTGVNRTIVFMQELSSSDFQLNPRGELYYIFVEPGYYYLSIDSIFINFWSVRIDTFY